MTNYSVTNVGLDDNVEIKVRARNIQEFHSHITQ